ncbi:MAG: hypothetical protein WBD41_00770 [Rhodococcus sp. (in: high G+C Gram-positive bacteria)]
MSDRKIMAVDDVEVRYATNADGTEEFDEFVANDVAIHLEALDECAWYLNVHAKDGRVWQINLGSKSGRAKGFANCEQIAERSTES